MVLPSELRTLSYIHNQWTGVFLDMKKPLLFALIAALTLLDLLALDDITTAGAWMPEIGFVIASVPALITLSYFAFRGPTTKGK